jgi:MFS family permease
MENRLRAVVDGMEIWIIQNKCAGKRRQSKLQAISYELQGSASTPLSLPLATQLEQEQNVARISLMGSAIQRRPQLGAFAPALVLLVVAILVNYVDRGNLSIAAPLLKDELHISASQLGILLSAFFWTYTALQFVGGWLVDRVEATFVLAGGYLVWSVATAATGLAQGFVMLLLVRLMLGIGESVAFPASSKILARYLPEQFRGFANGAIMAGMKAGPAVGTLGAGSLMAKYGWRPVFLVIGLASLVWLPAWAAWRPRGQGLATSLTASAPRISSMLSILRQRSFWGVSAGHFSHNYLLYFMLTWLPFYLVHERHLSMTSMVKVAGLYYTVDALSAATTGWFTDFFIRRGYRSTVVRKSAAALGHVIATLGLAGCALANAHFYLAGLITIGIGCGMAGSGLFAFSQTLAGPRVAGTWTGLQNGVANFAGVIGPALTGFTVDRTGNFLAALAITGVVSVAGALAWVLGVERLEQISWDPEGAGSVQPASAVQ